MVGGIVGRTKVLGIDPNQFSWPISSQDADLFERTIFNLLQLKLASIDGTVKVIKTRRSGDHGRDIEIQFTHSVTIGDQTVFPRRHRELGTIYIECKISQSNRLDEGFLSDASQHHHEEFDAYVLVTNSTLTPYAHYRAQLQWGNLEAKFILIDRARLRSWLFSSPQLSEPAHLFAPVLDENTSQDDVVVTHQSCVDLKNGVRDAQTYLVVRNYSHSPQRIALSLASDLSWASDVDLEAILEPGEDRAYRLEARATSLKRESEGIPALA
jgi:hypothetical protein